MLSKDKGIIWGKRLPWSAICWTRNALSSGVAYLWPFGIIDNLWRQNWKKALGWAMIQRLCVLPSILGYEGALLGAAAVALRAVDREESESG